MAIRLLYTSPTPVSVTFEVRSPRIIHLYSMYLVPSRPIPTQRRIFLCENIESCRLEGYIVCGHNVPMHSQVESVVKFTIEITQRYIGFRYCLEHHFSLRSAMLDQQYLAEPSFAHNLYDIELIHKLNLYSEKIESEREISIKTLTD